MGCNKLKKCLYDVSPDLFHTQTHIFCSLFVPTHFPNYCGIVPVPQLKLETFGRSDLDALRPRVCGKSPHWSTKKCGARIRARIGCRRASGGPTLCHVDVFGVKRETLNVCHQHRHFGSGYFELSRRTQFLVEFFGIATLRKIQRNCSAQFANDQHFHLEVLHLCLNIRRATQVLVKTFPVLFQSTLCLLRTMAARFRL